MDLSVFIHQRCTACCVFGLPRYRSNTTHNTTHRRKVLMHPVELLHINFKPYNRVWGEYKIIIKNSFEIFFAHTKQKIENENLILIFCFGCYVNCCCSPSSLPSSSSIFCILACARRGSNALVGTLCCNIAPCGSPCIFERSVHWVVVCCMMNNKQEEL